MEKNSTLPIPSYIITYSVIGALGTLVLGVMALLLQLIRWLITEPYWNDLSITLTVVAFIVALLLTLSWITLDAAIGLMLYLLLSSDSLTRWLTLLRHRHVRPLRWFFQTQVAVIEWLLEGQLRSGPDVY